jgi:hypothetical protein
MTRRRCAACVAVALCAASPAAAQSSVGRLQVTIGPAWIGGASMSALNVTETQADGSARTVFSVARELASAVGVEARIGVRVSPRLDVEATGSYARPQLQLTASNDVEGAATMTASETLQQFTVGGAVSWFLVRRHPAARTMPFVAGGVAYARQLHQPSTVADSGAIVDFGGGVEEALMTSRGALKSLGIRAEVRVRERPAALMVDGRWHASPILAASLFLRF